MRGPLPLFKNERTLCCVFGCSSKITIFKNNDTRFHKLPVNSIQLLQKWVNAIKLPRRISGQMILCSKHFQDEDYHNTEIGVELKPGAVPNQNLPKIWRNKFLPRDYGKLIKVLEYRGIGRLRLCFEGKLSRHIRKAELKRQAKLNSKAHLSKHQQLTPQKKTTFVTVSKSGEVITEKEITTPVKEQKTKTPEKETSPSLQEDNADVTIISSSEPMTDGQEHSLTSEIVIKEELLSEPEDTEETVEEMLAKMNEESQDDAHVREIENEDNIEWESLCNICGEEECDGHLEEKFECVPCGKHFRTSRQLNAHNLSHFEYRRRGHVTDKEAICKVCNKVLSTKTSLNEHMLAHSHDSQHVCMLCDKTFRHKASLVTHINSHTIYQNYRCKTCGQCFGDEIELTKHMRKHKVVIREYTCRECGQKFRSKQACWVHLNSHMRAKVKPGLSCDVCGRVLSTKATLKEHMFIHSGEKPFECQLCGRKIRHRANFIIHVQGHSLGQPHICSMCGMGFAKKSELFSHHAAEHPEDRPFFCIICGMRFRTEVRFHRHATSHDAFLEGEV